MIHYSVISYYDISYYDTTILATNFLSAPRTLFRSTDYRYVLRALLCTSSTVQVPLLLATCYLPLATLSLVSCLPIPFPLSPFAFPLPPF